MSDSRLVSIRRWFVLERAHPAWRHSHKRKPRAPSLPLTGASPAAARSKPRLLLRRLPLTLHHPPPPPSERRGGGGWRGERGEQKDVVVGFSRSWKRWSRGEGWMEAGMEGEGRGVSPRSGDDAGVGWGWRGATGALGRLFEFQLPPHYINTHWCHTLVTHVFTHTHRHWGDL